jgi:hypothetical protein
MEELEPDPRTPVFQKQSILFYNTQILLIYLKIIAEEILQAL